jgi:hypothetical protein
MQVFVAPVMKDARSDPVSVCDQTSFVCKINVPPNTVQSTMEIWLFFIAINLHEASLPPVLGTGIDTFIAVDNVVKGTRPDRPTIGSRRPYGSHIHSAKWIAARAKYTSAEIRFSNPDHLPFWLQGPAGLTVGPVLYRR